MCLKIEFSGCFSLVWQTEQNMLCHSQDTDRSSIRPAMVLFQVFLPQWTSAFLEECFMENFNWPEFFFHSGFGNLKNNSFTCFKYSPKPF